MSSSSQSLSVDQKQLITNISMVVSICSISMGVIVVILYLVLAPIRRLYHAKLIILLIISDTLLALSGITDSIDPSDVNHTQCLVLGFLKELSWIMSVFLSASFSFFLRKLTSQDYRKSVNFEHMNEFVWRIIFIATSLSLFLSLIPFLPIEGSVYYGETELFCWIRSQDSEGNPSEYGLMLQFGLFYLPLLVVLVLTLAVNIGIMRRLRKVITNEEDSSNNYMQFMMYPVVLLICNICAVVDRWLLHTGVVDETWILLHVILMNGQALVNGLLYGMTSYVQQHIKRLWMSKRSKICCCTVAVERDYNPVNYLLESGKQSMNESF